MIGEIINKLRKQKGLSQSELGKKLCLSASAIGMYEQNRRLPDTDAIIKLSNFFSVSVDYLLELSDVKNLYVKSTCNDTVQKRIKELIKFNGIDIDYVASVSNIRKRRLLDIIDEYKTPDINEIRSLSLCFNESSDYILGITDEHKPQKNINLYENSFAKRLRVFLDNYSEQEVSIATNIPIWEIRKLADNEEIPSMQILCAFANYFKTSTDYLLALTDINREPDSNGIYPFEICEKACNRIIEITKNDSIDYLVTELGITNDEFYNFIHYGFIPHISVLTKLCKLYNLSSDYILGLSDSKLSIFSNLQINEDDLLKSYRSLNINYRKKVDGFIAEQLIQQERDKYIASVAADEQMKSAK